MSNTTKLPPLPDSDPDSIARNKYHGFYKMGSRDFWGNAEVITEKIEDFKPCTHYFVREWDEVRCQLCHMGWQAPGNIQAQNGQLYVNNERVQL